MSETEPPLQSGRARGEHGVSRSVGPRFERRPLTLHADPQHAPLGQTAKVANDPLRVALPEHLDLRLQLALERVALRRILRGHRLHGHTPVAIRGSEDRAVRSAADLLAQLEVRRARGRHSHPLNPVGVSKELHVGGMCGRDINNEERDKRPGGAT